VLPTPKKAADRRQGSHSKDVGKVVALSPRSVAPVVAAARLDWAPEVAEAWAELWSSPLAGLIRPTDVPAVRRLFDLRHRLIETYRAYDEDPISVGSMGQPVLSPFAAEAHRIESELEKLEDRFGLTPLARLRLGVTFEEGVSLASRNAQLLEAFKEAQSGSATSAGHVRASGRGVDRSERRPRGR
jgi:hypothetical protein